MKLKLLIIITLSCIAFTNTNAISLVNAFKNLTFTAPVFLTHSNDATNRIFVVQQNGAIIVFPNDSNANTKTVFLNVSNKIIYGGERGLLGLAFHPNYSSNGYFYIYYTQVTTGSLIISRFKVSVSNPNKADSLSELILLNIPHSDFPNHNGGNLLFGLDTYLYIGTGDGGSGGDPFGNGQNKNVLLGKILRINVNTTSGGNNYSIPPDNPFFNGGGKAEIFAWGMRNPWRFSQDAVSGLIYVGDVGQNLWEEVDILENGKNYGWNIMEATHCYNPPTGCNQTGLTLPIKEYGHVNSDCSISGGYVYRGPNRPDLTGRYIYGDYCTGRIAKFKYIGGVLSEDENLITSPSPILSFGTDQQNELYVLTQSGIIYKFNPFNQIGIEPNSEIVNDFYLYSNYPNPFNSETIIRYDLRKTANVQLSIYNVSGILVKTIVNGTQHSGNYSYRWNGKDNSDISLPSGVYFIYLTADGFSIGKKLVLAK